jgi:hypothetical protein
MLCCGIFALSAAVLGVWRLPWAVPRILPALAMGLLATVFVVALIAGAASDGGMTRAEAWALAELSLCDHDDQAQSIESRIGEVR